MISILSQVVNASMYFSKQALSDNDKNTSRYMKKYQNVWIIIFFEKISTQFKWRTKIKWGWHPHVDTVRAENSALYGTHIYCPVVKIKACMSFRLKASEDALIKCILC